MMHVIESLPTIASDYVKNILIDHSSMEGSRDRHITHSFDNFPVAGCKFVLDEIIVASLVGVHPSEQIHFIIEDDRCMPVARGRLVTSDSSKPEPVIRGEGILINIVEGFMSIPASKYIHRVVVEHSRVPEAVTWDVSISFDLAPLISL